MVNYFNINHEFDKKQIHECISECIHLKKIGYICVAGGVILDIANRNLEYQNNLQKEWIL